MPACRTACLLIAPLLLSGCIARAAADIARAPVRAASRAADLATTSQAERDRNRGRDLRQREARLAALERDHARAARRCESGEPGWCERRDAIAADIRALAPMVPRQRD